MQKKGKLLLGIFTGVIVIAFFLPWIEIQSGAVGLVSKVVTGKRKATIEAVSGFRVPIMANGPDARFMIDVIKIFNPNIKDADKKSWLIWGVPILAVFLWRLFLVWGEEKWFLLGLGIVGVSIFAVGAYDIATTNLNKVVLSVKISVGLWLTLVGYLAMGLTGFVFFISKKNK